MAHKRQFLELNLEFVDFLTAIRDRIDSKPDELGAVEKGHEDDEAESYEDGED